MKTALLLSGGLDSIALLWWKRPDITFTVDYGQKAAKAEVSASRTISKQLGIPNYLIEINCQSLGTGDMAGADALDNAPASDWWPYRNQLLITLVAMKAIQYGATHLWIGTVNSDSIHLDGTSSFINAMSSLLTCQEGGLCVEAPAMNMSTIELIQASGIPIEQLSWGHSCHKQNVVCGECRGCNKYFETFEILNHIYSN